MSQKHGFSSAMKFIIFFICVPLVYSEYHSLIISYTGYNGQPPELPEFIAQTFLDGKVIDSSIPMPLPKEGWMEDFKTSERWKEYTEIREKQQQIYKDNIPVIMQRFNHSGFHLYMRSSGCDYNDETDVSEPFDRYTYDGENFISLDLNEGRYTAHVPQAIPTVEKWNNALAEINLVLKRYYENECVYWLKHFLALKKAGFKRRGVLDEM